jgi:hypothetical protein
VEWSNSTWFAVCGYSAIVVLALVLGYVELARRRADTSHRLWPGFWFATAVLLTTMTLARVSDSGELLADLGRQRADSQGWYGARRSLQAGVVGSIAAIWGIVVILAIWRVPERRRRYLPTALVVFTLVCFASVRVISLHQVDALLYNRNLGDVTIRAVIELSLLAVTIVVAFWQLLNVRISET